MKHILIAIALICGIRLAAQNASKPVTRNSQALTWQQCDSLGDAAMFEGDTSVAVDYYQKSIQLNASNKDKSAAYEKLKRHYRHAGSSFYLQEH